MAAVRRFSLPVGLVAVINKPFIISMPYMVRRLIMKLHVHLVWNIDAKLTETWGQWEPLKAMSNIFSEDKKNGIWVIVPDRIKIK
jgi:hypothetical protein